MRRQLVYLRLAKGARGYRVSATTNPPTGPITQPYGDDLPTVTFAIALTFDPAIFNPPRVIAEIGVPDDTPQVTAELVEP